MPKKMISGWYTCVSYDANTLSTLLSQFVKIPLKLVISCGAAESEWFVSRAATNIIWFQL